MVSRLADPNDQGGMLGLAQSLASLGPDRRAGLGGILFDRFGPTTPTSAHRQSWPSPSPSRQVSFSPIAKRGPIADARRWPRAATCGLNFKQRRTMADEILIFGKDTRLTHKPPVRSMASISISTSRKTRQHSNACSGIRPPPPPPPPPLRLYDRQGRVRERR